MQNCPRQLAMQSCVLCSFVRCGTSNQIEEKKNQISNVISKSGSFEQQSNLFYYTVLKHGLSPQNNSAGWMDAILVSCDVSKIYPGRTTQLLKPSMESSKNFIHTVEAKSPVCGTLFQSIR